MIAQEEDRKPKITATPLRGHQRGLGGQEQWVDRIRPVIGKTFPSDYEKLMDI